MFLRYKITLLSGGDVERGRHRGGHPTHFSCRLPLELSLHLPLPDARTRRHIRYVVLAVIVLIALGESGSVAIALELDN